MNVAQPIFNAPKFAKEYHLPELLELMNHPERQLKVIHVVGTNGKGSVSNYLSRELQYNGFKVGLFTSPAFIEHNERIKVNGEMISDELLQDYINKYRDSWLHFKLTFFEIWVFICIMYFADQKIDVAVMEAGIGGIKDATNLFEDQWATLLTSVSFDHMEILGKTIDKILENKIGICNFDTPLFVANSNRQYEKKIKIMHDGYVQADDYCQVIDINQQDNIGLVIAFLKYNKLQINYEIFKYQPTLGRMTVLRANPFLIIDGAHNVDGVSNLLVNVKRMGIENPIFLYASSLHKDHKSIMKVLTKHCKRLYITQFKSEMSWDVSAIKFKNKVIDWPWFIKEHLNEDIVVFGSLYFIPLVYEYFLNMKRQGGD